MIGVPASIHVSWLRAASGAVLILSSFPVFYLGAAALLIRDRHVSEMDHWIYSGVMVLVPTAIWTFAKSGGSPNSFLYAYLAMASLLVSQFPAIARWIDSLPAPRILPATIALAISMLGSYFFEFQQSLILLTSTHGDEKIGTAIALARSLGGEVISPEDPSIAYRANGHLGGSVFFELDAHAINGEWPSSIPPAVAGELSRAKAVIEVHGYVPMPGFLEALLAQKFRPIVVPALEKSAYTLWLKSPAAVSH